MKCHNEACEREAILEMGVVGTPYPYCTSHALMYMELATRIIEGTYEAALIAKVKGDFGIG